jgi:hypothetical protein
MRPNDTDKLTNRAIGKERSYGRAGQRRQLDTILPKHQGPEEHEDVE